METEKLTERQQALAVVNLRLLQDAVMELTEPWRKAEQDLDLAWEQWLDAPAYARANNPQQTEKIGNLRKLAADAAMRVHREYMLSAPTCLYMVGNEPKVGLMLVEA